MMINTFSRLRLVKEKLSLKEILSRKKHQKAGLSSTDVFSWHFPVDLQLFATLQLAGHIKS